MYMKSSQQALMFSNEKGLLYSFACHEVSVKFRQKILFIELAPRAIISLLTKNTRFVAHKMGIKARGTFKFILFMWPKYFSLDVSRNSKPKASFNWIKINSCSLHLGFLGPKSIWSRLWILAWTTDTRWLNSNTLRPKFKSQSHAESWDVDKKA